MHRRNVILAASAAFALGVAFAAQPTTTRDATTRDKEQQRSPWVPGTNALMSAHESSMSPLLPPR